MIGLKSIICAVCLFGLGVVRLQAAFVLEIDTDGADDGVLTFNSLFSFGNDTTTASQSTAGTALGLTGGDSIFGGTGVNFPDTYLYNYSPDSIADNLVLTTGTDLGGGNLATGVLGGSAGLYNVYATWPSTTNVSGGLTTYTAVTSGDSFSVSLNQNGLGDEWIFLGQINYTSGMIQVEQKPEFNTFVSQRASGLLFEAVPEPSATLLLWIGGYAFASRRRRPTLFVG
ncbi:MAG: PEP-CTERM sorting domain-containing protein [Planctomycetales bacterium]|nr:PEP-CTERM sorting domain-containing protein [Planctomycetales bacterium]